MIYSIKFDTSIVYMNIMGSQVCNIVFLFLNTVLVAVKNVGPGEMSHSVHFIWVFVPVYRYPVYGFLCLNKFGPGL